MSEIEVPKGWDSNKLLELTEIEYGKTLTTKELKDQGYPVFGANGVIGHYDKFNQLEESVLISCRGANSGKINISPEKCFITNNSLIVKIKDLKILDKKFLFYALHSLPRKEIITGSAQPQVTIENLSSVSITYPNIEIQKQIVKKLDNILVQFEEKKKEILQLQNIKNTDNIISQNYLSILKSAFVGDLTKSWRDKNLKSVDGLLEKIQQENKKIFGEKFQEPLKINLENLPNIPKSWKWARIVQIVKRVTDGEHITPERTLSGVLLLSARNIQNGYLSLTNVDHIPENEYDRISKRLIIKSGDVLLSCSGSVGRSCVVPDNLKFSLVRSAAVLKPFFDMGDYISFAIRSPFVQNQILDTKRNTAQANIFQKQIKALVIPVAPLEEQIFLVKLIQNKFAELQSINSKISEILLEKRKVLKYLDSVHDSVLRSAFSGKLMN